jgi:purine-nucleoside phosphorylase
LKNLPVVLFRTTGIFIKIKNLERWDKMVLREKIQESVNFIKSKIKIYPKIAIILGTGLGAISKEIKNAKVISYEEIPHFPSATALTHAGELVVGKIYDKIVCAMAGRFHYYEGYSLEQITFPIRVMKKLGIKILIVSNAAGGMNRTFDLGDIMVIADHVNFMGVNPLIGPNDDRLGPRFPDMFNTYDQKLINLAEKVALNLKIPLKKGVYVGVTGPNLETPAEYRFFSSFADAVGMSTVPEVIVARHSGLKVLGFSVITDLATPERLGPVNIDEIIKVANQAEPKLSKLVKELIRKIKI